MSIVKGVGVVRRRRSRARAERLVVGEFEESGLTHRQVYREHALSLATLDNVEPALYCAPQEEWPAVRTQIL